jgi:cyclohexadieny/prephenate dehydrogenase
MSDLFFERVAFIGIGHIGSSLARLIRREKLAGKIIVCDRSSDARAKALELGIADEVTDDAAIAVTDADLVVIATPLSQYQAIGTAIAPALKKGAIVTDVGSVKELVVREFLPLLPEGVHLVPGHPVAGTENSGPESGFAEVFKNRWCILTPVPLGNEEALEKIAAIWRSGEMQVEMMDAAHHDRVLAITSHVPHLIAYTIVGTATDLEETLKSEVIKFSASGFRDFTRIAASDPVMWRDIFLNNREAVLEVLQRLNEDLTAMQRAIRWGEGDKLQDRFAKTRAIRRSIVEAKQA